MPIHNDHDFIPLPRFVLPISSPPPLAGAKVASMKHSDSSSAPSARSVLASSTSTFRKFTATPLLETAVHSLVVRVTLRQHVPLRTRVQNPQDGFEHRARRNRFPSWPAFRNMFPENALGCVPSAHRSDVTCFQLYSTSLTDSISR
jgi:hypothetical protein